MQETSTEEHIPEDKLLDWLDDRLDRVAADQVERHLGICEQCSQRLAQFDRRPDPLLSRLRQQYHSSQDAFDHAGSLPFRGSNPTRSLRWGPLNNLQIKSIHSSGSVGRIWLARDADLGRDVAIKEVLPRYAKSPRIRARFRREARIAAQLQHPGVPVIHSFHEDADRCLFVMQFLDGNTLEARVNELHSSTKTKMTSARHLSRRDLLLNLVAVCDTIVHAHSHGIIHRDLKGDNIIICRTNAPVVIDWGVAKQIAGRDVVGLGVEADDSEADDSEADDSEADDSEADDSEADDSATKFSTIPGQLLGTPAFMSPEQVLGDKDELDFRSDIYSLGAVLYQILCGEAPFHGAHLAETLDKIMNQAPRSPAAVAAGVSVELEAICLKALAKRKEDRYRDVQSFQTSLLGALG